jgi:hypothetical protein
MIGKSVSKRPIPIYWFFLFALLFSIQVFPRLSMDSPCGDEAIDITDGYYYWKGDVISDMHHPPLAKALQSLSLLVTGVNSKAKGHFTSFERRDYNFLFVLNRDHFEAIVFYARLVTLLFGLGIGLLLFCVARGQSLEVTLFTMVLWSLEPNLLAFSGMVMADVPLTFFLLAAVLSFQRLGGKSQWGKSAVAGLLAGMAVTTKFSAAILAPVYLILEALRWRARNIRGEFRDSLWRLFWGGSAALLWIFLLYLPGTLKIPGFRSPFSYFWEGFSSTVSYSGHPTYFLGELTTRNHWAYYPLAFLLKSPISFLIFLFTAVWLRLTRRLRIPTWQWLTPCLLFAAVLPFLNIGVRQVLPIYPFFILVAAQGAQWLWSRRFPKMKFLSRILVAGLLAFQAISVVSSFPSQVSYLNEVVTPAKRLFWLGDSNLDVGQDTKRLAETARQRGWKKIKLAYFGTTDPKIYGMKWDYWRQKDLSGPQPGWVYAVNVSFLQLGPAYFPAASAILSSWISRRPPDGRVGSTWYYYEIPGEADPLDKSPLLPSTSPFQYYEGLNQ